MSIFYEVFEHLVIEDTNKHDDELRITLSNLSQLGAWILDNRGSVGSLRVIADGEEYTFSGSVMTQAYHEALNAAREAEKLEIIWDYAFSCYAMEVGPGPFALTEHLDEVLKEDPESLDGLFYSAYNNADCSFCAGVVVAYGKKNGVMYTGEVPYVTADHISDGDWYTPLTAVVCELDETVGKDLEQIEKVCRELSKFSSYDSLEVSDDEFSFALNNLRIKNDAELKQFMKLYARLISLTGGECGLIGELVDVSGPDVQMLRFDVNADGTYTMEVAAVQ